MNRYHLLSLVIGVVLLGVPLSPAFGHGMRTAYLEITEDRPGHGLLLFRTTLPDSQCKPVLPKDCKRTEALFECEGPLSGKTLSINGLGPIITEAVVRIRLFDGQVLSTILLPTAPSFTLPAGTNKITAPVPKHQVLGSYIKLGIEHILQGADHLLFLLGLLFLVRRPRALLVTETAFTLSHSLTFSAVALGLVRVSSGAAEACIALSLVLLALDLQKEEATKNPSIHYAALLAFSFGLVHGLGFAGGLSEIGLPKDAVGLALVGFALGVEAGQIAFLVVTWLLFAACLHLRPRWEGKLVAVGSAAIGIIGAYWFWQRIL